MNIPKAIEILSNHGLKPEGATWQDYLDAIKLSIEALKLYKTIKANGLRSKDFMLPGETPETNTNRSLHHIKEVLESPLGRP